MINSGLDKKLEEKIRYLKANKDSIELSSYQISGIIDYIHYRRRLLFKNDQKIFDDETCKWIISKTKLAKENSFYNNDIHSSFLQFIFRYTFQTFNSFKEIRLSIHYKQTKHNSYLYTTRKKDGGKYGLLIKITKNTVKRCKNIFILIF